jgi:DNA replicative helicase MCM subunit Mcm2 (Cdc46/Mcm family)
MQNGRFRPGDKVPVTGIYTAKHDQHRKTHEVFATEGDRFPNCRKCGERVNFALAHAASRIDEDGSFGKAGRVKPARKPKKKLSGDG